MSSVGKRQSWPKRTRAYHKVKLAYAIPKDQDGRSERIRAALEAATDVPLRVAGLAESIAAMAAELHQEGNRNLEGDAVTAVLLAAAAAAARSAMRLVEGNVALGRLDPALSARARAHVDAIAAFDPSIETPVR